ncbi:ETS-related transcription factor Elf-2 [Procambarus clarkii]|uniref:ETS-related transcription factor Elf-2 n=1 Tax=Procambarus clarkii TaxID=6728 RepID=UPI001E67579E|nr:ETS-related transcription factor Elf-2-like [Procambarus clarkii]
MEGSNYEDLRASLTFDEPLFGHGASIDNLCQTYLGDLDSYCPGLELHYPGEETYNTGLLEQIEAFSKMDVSDWRGEDCLDWAGSVCRRRGLDQTTVDLWVFRNTCGSLLLQYTCQDFCSLVGAVYGPVFHQEFTQMRHDRDAGELKYEETGSASPHVEYPWGTSDTLSADPWDLTNEDIKDLDRYIDASEPADPLSGGLQEMDLYEQSIYYGSASVTPEPVAQMSAGGDGTPVLSSDPLKKIRPDAKKRERGPKNWEFVIRLLADSQTNPSLIRWEEQSQGTFRLVQPSVIARMWGQRADKPNLSYDNFARGLRYHYTTGALQPVSEKQLVYKCGPKALKYLIELKRTLSA